MKLVVEILCDYRLQQAGLFPVSLDELVQNWVRLNLFPNVFELAVLLYLLIICYRETWTVSAEL